MSEKNHEAWMRRAIALSHYGFPAPNPHVGCVIVQKGEIVGEGWHEFAGGPHAEVMALKTAGPKAKGSDVYVTLEPCNHHGRTGPCSDALIEAGVSQVFVACSDPNPKAQGGADRLREAGIRVHENVLEAQAFVENQMWLTAMRRKRPYVCAKAAITLDGRIALPNGESKWITSEHAREDAHFLRGEMGAVLVGVSTVLQDDPSLTVRVRGVHNQPTRLVLDPKRRLSGREKLFTERRGEAFWFVGDDLPITDTRQIALPTTDGQFSLESVLQEMWNRGMTSLLVEGGGKTIAGFLKKGFVDRIDLFVAPKVFGAGPSWVDGSQIESLSELMDWRFEEPKKVGQDIWIRAYSS